jgi:hypothetical protein
VVLLADAGGFPGSCRRLVFDGRVYKLKLEASQTKSRRPYGAAVPHELTPYRDLWLEIHRVQLIARPETRSAAWKATSGPTAGAGP